MAYATIRNLLLSGLILAGATSCERLFLELPSTDPEAIFEEAWEYADREYAFFDFKNINWDEVYDEFRPKVNPQSTDEELFEVLDDMLYRLRDGHVNLTAGFDFSRNWRWYLDFPPNFNYNILERNYFQEQQQFIGGFTMMDFGEVGYIRYASFSSPVSDGQLDYILDQFQHKKGIIFDIRENGGGSVDNVNRIASRFTASTIDIGRQRFRNGSEHNDFSPWMPLQLEPAEEDRTQFLKPIILLTNRSCFSSATFFAMYMKALPNVTIIGDWTGGGGGIPAFTELANGWILRVSNTQTETTDGLNIEGGVPPDIEVELTEEDENQGIDTILEKAFELLDQ